MDERKYLEEIMNGGPFKLLHGYVIANNNVLICHCLLESLPSKTLTS